MKMPAIRWSEAAALVLCAAIPLARGIGAQDILSQIDVMRKNQARTAYFDVLDLYASGEITEAVEQLAEFEPQATRSQIEALNLRQDWFLEWLEALAEPEPEILIPAADLYARLFIHYKQIGFETKADAVARKVVRLLRGYRRQSQSQEADDIASRLLVDMGYAEIQMSDWLIHVATFSRVLDFDSRNPIALHMLAAQAEKQELYSEARKWLERLLAHAPENRPARLRLAVVLAQRGKLREAIHHLDTVIAGDDPRWAIIVAYQERARIHHQQAQTEQAIALLREARRRFPDDAQLVYLLAGLLSDRPAESMQVIGALSGKTSWEGPTPRAIYNNWPLEGQEEMIRQRRQELAERMPLLVEALKHRPSEPVT